MVAKPYQLGEYQIEPGWLIACNALAMHLRPDLYPEPDRFSPERFLEQSPGKFTWIPFGGGVRHCLVASRPTRRGTSSGPWSRGSASAPRRRATKAFIAAASSGSRATAAAWCWRSASSRPSRPGRRIRREARRPGGTGSEQCRYENDETDDQQRHDQQGEGLTGGGSRIRSAAGAAPARSSSAAGSGAAVVGRAVRRTVAHPAAARRVAAPA